jgi:AraC-like DNA-binding protein
MLWWARPNRIANRALALLLAAIALFNFPYIIGYAGYYDAYPWLSYFPYNLTLAFGPLLFCYLDSLLGSARRLPPRWGWHAAPAAVQLAYYSVMFLQPLAFKNDWDERVHVPYIAPVEAALVLLSLASYWRLSFRRWRACDDSRLDWGRNVLIAFGLTLLFWTLMLAAEQVFNGLTYFQRFPFYLWLAVLLCYLGTEGYRHGVVGYPVQEARPAPLARPVVSQAELGQRWRERIIAEQWWREADLSLATLARRLGTNSSALSKAINEGLGLNFSELLNRIRVDAVLAAFDKAADDQSILDIALAEGFSSKASFNRAFKLYTGATPSEYRRRGQVSSSA